MLIVCYNGCLCIIQRQRVHPVVLLQRVFVGLAEQLSVDDCPEAIHLT